ncbi:MAG: efflux RND transporter periplasmic adaptor subunit [Rhizomicrobium sp.]|nr:efflux RND transporter periplasmic adaptor subunit [Rhizomicrobium sp.]
MPDKQNMSFDTEMGLAPEEKTPHSQTESELLHYTPPKHLKWIGIGAGGVALAVVAIGVAGRIVAANTVQDWTAEQAVPVVKLVKTAGLKNGRALVLPGSVQAYNSAPIYAQVSGTVQKWFVDIGTPVKAGQLLAQIDPGVYKAALDQARGALARDMANLANAKQDLVRYQSLSAQNAISSQQLQTQQSTVNADAGLVEADRAAVDAANINLGYTKIVAPFDGVMTSRSVDIGNYVAVGNASATPLFTVSDQSKLRLYVRVPQGYSAQITAGATASFTVPDYPGRSFTATVMASSGAVDSASGSVLVQLLADNTERLLKPGSYAQVSFSLHSDALTAQLPASALTFRDGSTAVAVLGADNRVIIRPVQIARDNGQTVELAKGLKPSDRIIDNPPDSLSAGDAVHLAPAWHS